MTTEQKLAGIVRSLQQVGIDVLVMGGHAVRYYGVDRNTNDFDLVTSVTSPTELRERLPAVTSLGIIREEPMWRRNDFARFEVGKLPDGREEWLEFWLRNHLLPDFSDLKKQSEVGEYGGEMISFLGLEDLIRSKETERESDWQDIMLLEEIADDRKRVRISASLTDVVNFLASVRSRRAMDYAIDRGLLRDEANARAAIQLAKHPVTRAFLAPFAPAFSEPHVYQELNQSTAKVLASAVPGSTKHFAVVEIVRRDRKRVAMDRDRADKQFQLSKNLST